MKTMSVRLRNIYGAFVGGVLGTIFAGFLHPVGLPFGCFLGAALGFGHQEIIRAVSDVFSWFAVRAQSNLDLVSKYFNVQAERIGSWSIQLDWPHRSVSKVKLLSKWSLQRPAAIKLWWNAHPMNQELAVRVAAWIFFAVGNLALFLILIPAVRDGLKNVGSPFLDVLATALRLTSFILLAPVGHILVKNLDRIKMKEKRRLFWQRYERFSMTTKTNYFFHELKKIGIVQLSYCGYITAQVFLVPVMLVSSFLVVAVIAVGAGIVQGVHEVTRSEGYKFCAGVTLTVTSLTAWFTFPHWENQTAVWLSALFAGCASAVTVELTRPWLASFIEGHKRLQELSVVAIEDRIRPRLSALWNRLVKIDGFLWARLPQTSIN